MQGAWGSSGGRTSSATTAEIQDKVEHSRAEGLFKRPSHDKESSLEGQTSEGTSVAKSGADLTAIVLRNHNARRARASARVAIRP